MNADTQPTGALVIPIEYIGAEVDTWRHRRFVIFRQLPRNGQPGDCPAYWQVRLVNVFGTSRHAYTYSLS